MMKVRLAKGAVHNVVNKISSVIVCSLLSFRCVCKILFTVCIVLDLVYVWHYVK
jgi:hypothetical protein